MAKNTVQQDKNRLGDWVMVVDRRIGKEPGASLAKVLLAKRIGVDYPGRDSSRALYSQTVPPFRIPTRSIIHIFYSLLLPHIRFPFI